MNSYMASGHTCGLLSSCSSLKIIHPTYAFPDLKKSEQKQAEGISISEEVLGTDALLSSPPFNTQLLSITPTFS